MKTTCKKTGVPFEITDFEVNFIKKVSPVIEGEIFEFPLPNICPDERVKARTIHRNEQVLYKNVSAFTEKPLISLYRPNTEWKIVSKDEWFSDMWNPLEYGQVPDFSKPFFTQFQSIQKQIPRAATVTLNNENSEYTTGTGFCKDCYLINSSEYCEKCYYSKLLQNCKNIIDSSFLYDSEYCYQCFDCSKCFNCQYCLHSVNCHDCLYCENCIGCANCFGCINLKNKNYYFMNKKYSKEEYEKKLKDLELEKIENRKNIWKKFREFSLTQPHKYAQIVNSENCTGDFIINSKNCQNCYDMNDSEDSMHVQLGVAVKSNLDCSNMYVRPEQCYQTLGTIEVSNCHFCLYVFHSRDLLYCEQCFTCNNCFGCIGLRNKEYCIFNKQYTPKEYFKTVKEIIRNMQKTGEWGQYFPASLSPFAYNESVAYNYFPLTENEAQKEGYEWFAKEGSDFQGEWYTPLPISDYNEKIVGYDCAMTNIQNCINGIIRCSVTGKPFKIIRQELAFYIENQIPIPDSCPDERYCSRMKLRNPHSLHDRKCGQCGIKVSSTYAPERPEKILCEKCFQDIII